MTKGTGDGLELIGYFIFFWAFVFNKKFRAMHIQEWNASGYANRFFMILEACSSIFCGVVLPVMVLYWVFAGQT